MLQLWNGVPLIPDDPSSQTLRAALLAVSSDLPAVRKITQFLGHKADMGCSKCTFSADREPGKKGATGHMSYFTPAPCQNRSHNEVVEQAREFKDAPTKVKATKIAQKYGVRYSELLRLPYIDIVRMHCTDPMHTFLLGMVQRETELNLKLMTTAQNEEFVRRVKSMRVPYDLGRLPNNIFDKGERVDGITAAQWKLYIIVYARPCLLKLLPPRAYKCIVLLSEIVTLLCSPVFTLDNITTLYRLLHEHHQLFCQFYGKWVVTVNYHMSLHLPDMICDLGPPHSFWCFPYERMNGILAGIPNSNRNIELEVANRFIKDISLYSSDVPNNIIVPSILKQFTSSCEQADYSTQPPYPYTSWVLSCLSDESSQSKFMNQTAVDKGDVERWPIEVQHPLKKNIKINQQFLLEVRKFFLGLYGEELDYVPPRIDKYGRCFVNGQKFSSDFNSTDRGIVVKSMFVDRYDDLKPYYGVVRFYFTMTVVIKKKPKLHHLSYVTWLKFHSQSPEPHSKLHLVTGNFYESDRIISPRRYLCRCVLAPHKSSSFLVSELPH